MRGARGMGRGAYHLLRHGSLVLRWEVVRPRCHRTHNGQGRALQAELQKPCDNLGRPTAINRATPSQSAARGIRVDLRAQAVVQSHERARRSERRLRDAEAIKERGEGLRGAARVGCEIRKGSKRSAACGFGIIRPCAA